MRQLEAMDATLAYARELEFDDVEVEEDGGSTGYDHLIEMREEAMAAEPPFEEAELGRWLGWMQACVVARGRGTLARVRDINRQGG